MPEDPAVQRTTATGEWTGDTVRGDALLRLHARGIVLTFAGSSPRDFRIPFAELSGFAREEDGVVLYGARTSRLTLMSAGGADQLWAAVHERAFALPELARGARSVGSRRAGDPAVQARFFAALLQARRRAEEAHLADARVRALDGAEVATRTRQFLAELAQSHWPADLPEQRALGAEFEECCEGMFAACDDLAAHAADWFAAPPERQLLVWREWLAAAARLFAAADRAWGSLAAVLGGVRGPLP